MCAAMSRSRPASREGSENEGGSSMQKILTYVDAGTDGTSRLMRAIAQQLPPAAYEIRAVMADDIKHDAALFDNPVLFVMPGGADLPFCAALNGAPNKRIRQFIDGGGVCL